jgi:hypothetical protein
MPNLTVKDAHEQPFIAAISKKPIGSPETTWTCQINSTAPSAPQTVFVHKVQCWVAASSAAPRLSLPKAWGWQNSQSGATIPKSFGFEAATP